MDTIKSFLDALFGSPHYAFGWVVLAFLAILPAIVSGNLVQHYFTRLAKGEITVIAIYKQLLFNLVVLTICVCIMAYAFYLYVLI